MNKLSKIGLSALCGSLAAVSAANAGSLDVTGGATTTWVSNEGTASGNPLGFSSGIVFKGNGELDNGTTFTLTLSQTDQSAYSNGTIVLDTPSFGKFTINQASGGVGIDVKDDAMPTAWEETDGAGLTTGHDKISGVGASMSVEWKSPTVMGSTISLAYAPHNNGILVNDKGTSGSAGKNRMQGGYDVLLDLNTANAYMLPNIFLGYSSTAQDIDAKTQGTNLDHNQDHEEGVAGAVFSIGPVKFGAQASVEYLGNEQTGTDVWGYRNIAYGISFNVSDNLSLSYGRHESKKGLQSGTTEGTRVSEAESYQIAYTIGGASIKIAENSVSDQNYVTGTTGDRDGTTVALSLAF